MWAYQFRVPAIYSSGWVVRSLRAHGCLGVMLFMLAFNRLAFAIRVVACVSRDTRIAFIDCAFVLLRGCNGCSVGWHVVCVRKLRMRPEVCA